MQESYPYCSSGNCTPGSRSYSDLVDTWADFVCIHQLVLRPCPKSASMQYNCRRLTYGLFQLTHITWWPWRFTILLIERDEYLSIKNLYTDLDKFEWAMAAKTKTKHYYSAHNLATRGSFGMQASVHDIRSGQNLLGPFLRATMPMTVGSCTRAMADNGETKGLITPPSRWNPSHYRTPWCIWQGMSVWHYWNQSG